LIVIIKGKEKGVQMKYELEDIPNLVRSRNTCLAAFVLTLGFYLTLLYAILVYGAHHWGEEFYKPDGSSSFFHPFMWVAESWLFAYFFFGVPAFLLFALRNFFWKALQRITGAEQK